jgi:hypothetical protein
VTKLSHAFLYLFAQAQEKVPQTFYDEYDFINITNGMKKTAQTKSATSKSATSKTDRGLLMKYK